MHLFNLKKSLVSLYICLVALLAVVTFVEHVHGTEFVEKYVKIQQLNWLTELI